MNELQPPDELLEHPGQLENRQPRPSRPLLRTIETWDQLIGEIGDYPDGLPYEYLNDLGSRTLASLWLSRANAEGMDELLEWILPIVDEIDDRYREKSLPDDEGLNWDTNLPQPQLLVAPATP